MSEILCGMAVDDICHDEMPAIVPVILAGGAGRRLWPLSTQRLPKPYIKGLRSRRSLLQKTLQRNAALAPPVVVASARHRTLLTAQIKETGLPVNRFLLEPEGRNTAASVAAAAYYLEKSCKNSEPPLMLVLPSDHAMTRPERLLATVRRAAPLASGGALVTFGIQPSGPVTDYGYIQAGQDITAEGAARPVRAFHEKPPRAVARGYVRSGDYYWNSGIFLFRPDSILAALARHAPEIHQHVPAALDRASCWQQSVFLRREDFQASPAQSLDKAVMEKADNLMMAPVAPGWSDLGRWPLFLPFLFAR